nr:smalltalk protein [Bacteroides propionicigenes]
MSIKVSVWDKILKVIIAVASAIAGVIGGQVIGI